MFWGTFDELPWAWASKVKCCLAGGLSGFVRLDDPGGGLVGDAVVASTIGIVGVPHGEVPFNQTFFRNIGWRGGPAPARIYIPQLLDDVLEGRINPRLVLDHETDLDHVADAYAAMDERRAIKSLIRVGSR